MANARRISFVTAQEILDSRGYPTLEVSVGLGDGTVATVAVPAGASTGKHEARESRDGDPSRYKGRGVLHAIENVTGIIAPVLAGMPADDQPHIDATLLALDGTEFKERLGANAILGISLACARAAAQSHNVDLYRYLGGIEAHVLPVPMFNVLNGGKHAPDGSDIQEFKLIPVGAPTFREACRASTILAGARQLSWPVDAGQFTELMPSFSGMLFGGSFLLRSS